MTMSDQNIYRNTSISELPITHNEYQILTDNNIHAVWELEDAFEDDSIFTIKDFTNDEIAHLRTVVDDFVKEFPDPSDDDDNLICGDFLHIDDNTWIRIDQISKICVRTNGFSIEFGYSYQLCIYLIGKDDPVSIIDYDSGEEEEAKAKADMTKIITALRNNH